MTRLLAFLSAVLLLLSVALGQTAPAQIRIGDELSLTLLDDKDITGSYTVQDDGAIYVPRVGRVRVVGRTVAESQTILTTKFRAVYRDPAVYLSIKKQRPSSVFVVGGTEGVVEIAPGTDLRQVFAQAKTKDDNDLLRVSVYRRGVRIASLSATDLVSGRNGAWTGPVAANDVVVIEPVPYIRVWVSGTVRTPGQKKLAQGDDVYRAIALAGDLSTGDVDTPVIRSEVTVSIRRGEQTIQVPLVPVAGQRPERLEDGDTVVVEPPAYVRLTLAGEVARPGEVVVREGTPVLTALAAAGGRLATGTTRSLYLFRDGQMRVLDASSPRDTSVPRDPSGPRIEGSGLGLPLRAHDVVYVPTSDRVFYAFGEVARPGRYVMRDDRVYRLSDVLAEAGISSAGTTRRVYLMRPNPEGVMKPVLYRLDDYLKSGKPEGNPVVQPNDVVVIDRTKPNGINTITQAISGFFLFNTLFRR